MIHQKAPEQKAGCLTAGVSAKEAKRDSRIHLMIGFVQHRPGLFCVVLGFRASSEAAIAYVYSKGMRWPCCIFSA